ncbi:MAG: hypothetical protein ACAI25_05905 [Planctomycetota bacterium]
MNEKQRVQALGAATVVVLAIGAGKLFKKNSADDVVAPTSKAERGVAVVSSATHARSYNDVSKSYRPIVDADPFRPRIFQRRRDNRGGGGNGSRGDSVATPASSTWTPPGVALRLTGIIAADGEPQAIFEDRGAGTGKIVKKGDRLGDRQVAEIGSSTVVLGPVPGSVASVKTTTLTFSDRVDIAVTAITLDKFAIAAPSSSTKAGSEKLPELDDEKKKSVLEALKEKRKKSLGQPADQPTPEQPK